MSDNTEPVTVTVDGKEVTLSVEQLWEELGALGLREAVRELLNRECATHNRVMERVVTSAGFKRHPGAEALCEALRTRRTAGMSLATVAEGLTGEVTALRRLIEHTNLAIENAEHAGETTPIAVRQGLRRVDSVVHRNSIEEATERVDKYRRLSGSNLAGMGVLS